MSFSLQPSLAGLCQASQGPYWPLSIWFYFIPFTVLEASQELGKEEMVILDVAGHKPTSWEGRGCGGHVWGSKGLLSLKSSHVSVGMNAKPKPEVVLVLTL